MRGEISDNVSLGSEEAQVLVVRLQGFYNTTGIEGGEVHATGKEKRELLCEFHENPAGFELEKLVKMAWEV